MYRFIFIDDEDYIREAFSSLMDWESLGFSEAASLAGGAEAIDYLEKASSPIHVVVSDIRLGDMLGTDLALLLRQKYPALRVVLISGYKEFDYALSALRASVFDYILKPFSAAQLTDLFTRLKQDLDGAAQPDGQTPAGAAGSDALSLATDYIHARFQSDLTLEEVAGHVGMNPAYFSRYFKKNAGINFIDYLTGLRVDEAKKLLMQPQLKVYQVCERVGYSNLHHFYRLFKQYTGLTPMAYKQAHQESKT